VDDGEQTAEKLTVVVDGAPASRLTVDMEPPIVSGMRSSEASVSTSMLLALWGFAVLGFLMLVRGRSANGTRAKARAAGLRAVSAAESLRVSSEQRLSVCRLEALELKANGNNFR
jgi:hypothetical protein